MNNESPYLEVKRTVRTVTERYYNPNYGDNRVCKCGHSYSRHFDTYEDMYPCGCKYCGCFIFEEKVEQMKAKVEKQIVLTLSEDEARWLKTIIQNPLWTNSEQEDPHDRDMREKFWNALGDIEVF